LIASQVFWSDEDEGFIAVAPDLPGCSAFGETQQQALDELQRAIAAWIEAQRAAGNLVTERGPPPAFKGLWDYCGRPPLWIDGRGVL
jgi:predicted RNase H-like HicB family nuclease